MLVIIFLTLHFGCANIMGVTLFTAEIKSNMDTFVNEILSCRNIPGIGLAVVQDGISFAKGYGQADMEQQINASESTIFCLGSVTKSLTAMLLARLMSNGEHRFQWTTKMKDIMGDEYKFLEECITQSVTLTDILSHRTGLASADILLQAGVPAFVTREKLMKNLHYLPKLFEFRDTFYYNNFVYVLSGHVAEKLTNQSWEQLMMEQLFDPLNMTSTVFIDKKVFPTLAVPYVSDPSGKLQKSDKRLYNLHPFGPAGSVCSSPIDMTKWLRFITSEGKTDDGRELVNENKVRKQFQSTSSLLDAWIRAYSLSTEFPVSFDTYGYGFGWFTSYYRGYRLVHHAGSLYGYSCKIAYLPEKKSAFVFFTNGPGEAKFDESMDPIFFYMLDTVLGYKPWLNATTGCSYPDHWNKKKHKRSTVSKTLVSNKEPADIDMHCGDYDHPLYGTVNVKNINGSLHFRYGLIMQGTLSPGNNYFILDLQEPLRSVFLSPVIVSFDNLSQNKYRNVALAAFYEKYVFTRNEDIVNVGAISHIHHGCFVIMTILTKLTLLYLKRT